MGLSSNICREARFLEFDGEKNAGKMRDTSTRGYLSGVMSDRVHKGVDCHNVCYFGAWAD